jgi:opacity protein-like surface antigen
MSKQEIAAAATLAALIAGPAVAAETAPEPAFVAPYYARGANTNVYGLQYLWKPTCECEWLKRHRLEPRLGVNFSYWDGQQPDNQHPSLWEFGTHGYLRHFWHPDAGFEPYVELGLGIHALTHTRINNNREFGTWFQFGSRIGLGLAFDAGRRWELQAFLEHISNASLASPNDGITLKGIELRVALP